MHYILTALSLIWATGALICALHAWKSASRCELHASRLRGAVGRIAGQEAHTDSLTQQLQKLRGQFYALKQRIDDEPPPELAPVSIDDTGNLFSPVAAFCANYGKAQIEGPQSAAAACKCGYCVEMRQRRAEFRAAKIPATVGRGTVAKGE